MQISGRCRWPKGLDNKLVVTLVTKYDLSPLGPKGWMDVTPIAVWGVGVGRGSIIRYTSFLRIQMVKLLLNSARRRFREGGLRFFTAF